MRSKNSKFILLGVFVLLLFFVLTFKGTCYGNGSGRKGFTYAKSVENYMGGYYGAPVRTHDHPYDREQAYFGTHDWIAESALIVLYEHVGSLPAGCQFINLLYSDAGPYFLKMYFLLGTEAPDARKSGILIRIPDCDGTYYGTENLKTTDHDIRFSDSNNEILGKACAQGAQDCYNLAVNALLHGHCQKAAFFLGAMCHYIADATSYPHQFTSEDVSLDDIDTYRDEFVGRITKLTYRVERFRGGLSHDFFSIDYARNVFIPCLGEMGWIAAYQAGFEVHLMKWYLWNTFKDHSIDYYEVDESLENYKLDHLYSWHRDKFLSFTGEKAIYFNSVQDALNMAILHCAYAINLAIAFYQDCDCGGKSNPELEKLHELLNSHTKDQVLYLILGSGSLICAIYVISLVVAEGYSKLK